MRIIILITFLATSFNGFAVDLLTWDSVASVNATELARRAEAYLKENSPELKDVKIKLQEVSAGYREGQKRLFVTFYHDQSYVEGSEEIRKVQTGGKEIEHQFITFDIVVVRFDDTGQPMNLEIFGEKFPGSKEEFEKLFDE